MNQRRLVMMISLFVPFVAVAGGSDDMWECNDTICRAPQREVAGACPDLVDGIEETVSDTLRHARRRIGEVEMKAVASGKSSKEMTRDEVMCVLSDEVEDQLQCYASDFDPKGEHLDLHAILRCAKNGEYYETRTHWVGESEVGLNLGRYLTLKAFRIVIEKETNRRIVVFSCVNTVNGAIYEGSLEEVALRYRRFLESEEKRQRPRR